MRANTPTVPLPAKVFNVYRKGHRDQALQLKAPTPCKAAELYAREVGVLNDETEYEDELLLTIESTNGPDAWDIMVEVYRHVGVTVLDGTAPAW